MVSHKRNIFSLLVICALCASCGQNLNRSEYVAWVQDFRNGLHVKKIHSEFILDLQFMPREYLAVLNNENPSAERQTLEYYTLKVSMTDPEIDLVGYDATSQSEKQKRLYYFSYLFQNDLFVEAGGKRIPCALFHAEATDLKNVKTFVLGFDTEDKSLKTTFVIDSPKFSSFPIRLKINKGDIPTLKI